MTVEKYAYAIMFDTYMWLDKIHHRLKDKILTQEILFLLSQGPLSVSACVCRMNKIVAELIRRQL